MSSVDVRPFSAADLSQLTVLINAHVAAVVPNVTVPASTIAAQLERDPSEFLVDPWVEQRVTLIAEQRDRVVAAAHVVRYGETDRVSDAYRGAAEIRWLLYWPPTPSWTDSAEAGEQLIKHCLETTARWHPRSLFADGTLPAPGVYGVPEQWPHVRDLLRAHGFRADRSETVHLAQVRDIPRQLRLPVRGLRTTRSVGSAGVRISAVIPTVEITEPREGVLGYIELDTTIGSAYDPAGFGSWADVGNLQVSEFGREQAIDRWLLGQAADWLELGGVSRLLAYTEGNQEEATMLGHTGFTVLTRTERGLVRS